MKLIEKIILIITVCIIPTVSMSQTTDLVVKKRGDKRINSTISITTKNGDGIPKESQFQKSKYIYFKLTPEKGKLMFKFNKKDIDSLKIYLNIIQDKKYFWPTEVTPIIKRFPKKELQGVLVSYDKTKLEITQPFIFSYFDEKSNEIQIEETLWKDYDKYLLFYEKGKRELKEDLYKALKSLSVFTYNEPESMKFTFSKEAHNLYFETINNIVGKYNKETLKIEKIPSKKRYNSKNRELSAILYEGWKQDVPQLAPILDEEDSLHAEIIKQISNIDRRFVRLANGYILQIFYDNDYNEYKFELFINTISKLLIINTPKGYTTELKPIDIDRLELIEKENSDLERYNFKEDFIKLGNLINNNIAYQKYILDQDIVERLHELKYQERYPNYEIIDAFNALAKNDLYSFKRKIKQVADVATSLELITNVSEWLASLYYTNKKVDNQIIQLINQGKEQLKRNNVIRAGDTFEMAYRLNKRMPITQYYIGLSYYLQGQEYTGIRFFNNALKIEPNLMIPFIKEIEFYTKEEQWEEASKVVNKAIKEHPNNWYFLYKRAKIHNKMDQYDDAKNIVTEKLIKIRPQQIEQYFLMGDIFLKQDSLSKAREWYNRAGDIDPTHFLYEEKMKEWKESHKDDIIEESQLPLE